MTLPVVRVAAVVLILSMVQPVWAKKAPDPARIREQVADLPIGGPVTVDLLGGPRRCGHIHSIEADSFSIREVDLRQVVTIRYDEVKKVRKDFGRPGFMGSRPHPSVSRWVGLGIITGILVIGVVAAKSTS